MIKDIQKFNLLKKNIKLMIFDVDGTLTDGKIYMGNNGEVFKAFSIKDGCGIHDLLPTKQIVPVIITARESDIVKNRCKELNIFECWQNVRDKLTQMRELAEKYGLAPDENGIYKEIAYVGDDIIDLECMRHCGLTACPADAAAQVKAVSDFISEYNGGNGAVRDFIEYIVGD